jgi:hypothetical protein
MIDGKVGFLAGTGAILPKPAPGIMYQYILSSGYLGVVCLEVKGWNVKLTS